MGEYGGNCLGTGWKFPLEVDTKTGRIKTCSDEENIKQSIRIILDTEHYERVMRPNFGCNLNQFAFAELDYSTVIGIKDHISQCLKRCEPRIDDIETDVDDRELDSARLIVTISYKVKDRNIRESMEYAYKIE